MSSDPATLARREPEPTGIGTLEGTDCDLKRIGAHLEPPLQGALQAAYDAGRDAGRLLFEMRRELNAADVHRKGYADVVTEADYAAERLVVQRLRLETTPAGCGFLLEEGGQVAGESAWRWIVDPLDGTANYVRGRSIYCCSIGLFRGEEPVLGVIVAPALGHVYVAARGGGAWLNGVRLAVSQGTDLDQAFITTETTADGPGPVGRRPFGAHVRSYGAAAIELADVAAGRSEAHVQVGLKPWDVAAGILLIEEAGGRVSGLHGEPCTMGPDVVGSNGHLHDAVLERLRQSAG